MDHFLGAMNAANAKCAAGFTPISDGSGSAFCIDPATLHVLQHAALPAHALHGLNADPNEVAAKNYQKMFANAGGNIPAVNNVSAVANLVQRGNAYFQKKDYRRAKATFEAAAERAMAAQGGKLKMSGLGADEGTKKIVELIGIGVLAFIGYKVYRGSKRRK